METVCLYVSTFHFVEMLCIYGSLFMKIAWKLYKWIYISSYHCVEIVCMLACCSHFIEILSVWIYKAPNFWIFKNISYLFQNCFLYRCNFASFIAILTYFYSSIHMDDKLFHLTLYGCRYPCYSWKGRDFSLCCFVWLKILASYHSHAMCHGFFHIA